MMPSTHTSQALVTDDAQHVSFPSSRSTVSRISGERYSAVPTIHLAVVDHMRDSGLGSDGHALRFIRSGFKR